MNLNVTLNKSKTVILKFVRL